LRIAKEAPVPPRIPQAKRARARRSRLLSGSWDRHGECFARLWREAMTDLLLVLLTVAFFALSWGYARFCEKL
jgi:hypothetical protein